MCIQYRYRYRCAFQWQHFGSPAEFLLHTKASFPPLNCEVQQFIFIGPDASWMAVKIAAGLWYMGFPVLTLGSPFLLHIITKAYTLSQRGNGKCSVATRLRRVRITGTILRKRNWNVSRVSCCIEPRPCAMWMCCFWLDTLYYCACFPVGLWRFSFLVFLLRWPDFRAGGKWDHGCRSKNQ